MQWSDSTERYGTISRFLHWTMALILVWQFITALAHLLPAETAVTEWLWGTHKTSGFTLMVLVVIRAVWALVQHVHRPPSIDRLARLGHIGLYALMLLVPTLALLRQFGSGKSFSPLGLPLMSGFEGDEIVWLVTPANLFHSWLGWTLLALIVGHVGMVIAHRRSAEKEDVLPRMAGRR